MKKNKLLDTDYKEWLEYYNTTCRMECNDKKYCPYEFFHACLGDILPNDVEDDRTFRDLLKEINVYEKLD